MGKSADAETTVRYAPYVEEAHQALMALAATERAANLDASPYGNYTVQDPDAAFFGTSYIVANFPSLYDMFGKFMAGFDVEVLWNQEHQASVFGPVVGEIIAADSAILQDDLDIQIASMKAGMRDIGAVMSTGFMTTEGNMRDTKTKTVAKELGDLRARFAELGQRRWEAHLDWNSKVIATYAAITQMYFQTHFKYINEATEKDAKNLLWNFQVLEFERAMIFAFANAPTSTRTKDPYADAAMAVAVVSTITQIASISSYRFKDLIETIGRIGRIRLVRYRYKNNRSNHIGVIAEEAERYYPHAVIYDHAGRPTMVNYLSLFNTIAMGG